ncbi:class I SAM-dependent methyltransferase [Candidatus Woesearchaeota archaeon]|nr:class I SAM-dependent methyltransferase [Candidatus Woesearchaeota archaeon]
MDSGHFYDEISEGYDELHLAEQLRKMTAILAALGGDVPKRSEKLLDVGCGSGISTSVWNCDCTGIDPSDKLIQLAKKKYPDKRWYVGRAEELPFPDDSFDVVVCVTAAHNFHDIRRGIEEIKRVGKDRFVITVLRKSAKAEEIGKLAMLNFNVQKVVMEDKDLIFVCKTRKWKKERKDAEKKNENPAKDNPEGKKPDKPVAENE